MWADEDDFSTPSGLAPERLGGVLVEAFSEVGGGRQASIELLHRTGDWLGDLDAAGFISLGAPHPEDPDARPRAVIRWAQALEATQWGGVLHKEEHDDRRDVRLLQVAAGLAGAVPVDLEACLRDLDRDRTRFVLAAVNASTQSHVVRVRERLPDGRDAGRAGASLQVEPLFAWPDPPEPVDERVLELPLFPERLAEEAVLAWAQSHPAPAVSLPLPAEVIDLLGRLWPARGRAASVPRSRRRHGDTLTRRWHSRGQEEVQDWLGFVLPDLSPLTDQRYRRFCFSAEPGVLPDRSAGLPVGHDRQRPVVLAWVPPALDLEDVLLHGSSEQGVAMMSIAVDDRTLSTPRPLTLATNLRESAGGYTSVTVAGCVLGVQRSEEKVTRIGWTRSGDHGNPQLVVHLPMAPVRALEVVLASRDIP